MKVGRYVGVEVGVGDTYPYGVRVGVRVAGTTGEGVIIDSGGYNWRMALYQSSAPVQANSLERAAGKEALQVDKAGKRSHP